MFPQVGARFAAGKAVSFLCRRRGWGMSALWRRALRWLSARTRSVRFTAHLLPAAPLSDRTAWCAPRSRVAPTVRGRCAVAASAGSGRSAGGGARRHPPSPPGTCVWRRGPAGSWGAARYLGACPRHRSLGWCCQMCSITTSFPASRSFSAIRCTMRARGRIPRCRKLMWSAAGLWAVPRRI